MHKWPLTAGLIQSAHPCDQLPLAACLLSCAPAHHSAVEELVRSHVPRNLARQLADAYSADAAAVLAKDPYSALQGLKGATWQIMDALAAARGLPPDLPSRGAAALVQVLVQAALEAGDTHLTWHQLASGGPWVD